MDQPLEKLLPHVYRFCLRLTSDTAAAEDLAQETMLRGWRQRGHLRDERAARVWLFRIAHNRWRDLARRAAVHQANAPRLALAAGERSSELERLTQRDAVARVEAAVERLPSRQREVLHLCAFEGLGHAEVAEVLGITADAVKANLSHARRALRESLAELDPYGKAADGRP